MRQSRTRAYRRHQRARYKARHIRDYYELTAWTGGFPPPKDVAVRHPRDCGRTRCGCCHFGKWDRERANERRRAIGFDLLASG